MERRTGGTTWGVCAVLDAMGTHDSTTHSRPSQRHAATRGAGTGSQGKPARRGSPREAGVSTNL